MARTSTRRPNLVAQAVVNAERNEAQDAQAAIDSVVVSAMREFVIATENKAEADRIAREAGENVANVKLAIMLKLAKAANAGKWGATAIKTALDAAMLVWAGNATTKNAAGKDVTPEERLASPVARRLRSEFNLAMLPDVRGKAAGIIERASVAWKEEEALPVADRVLHAKYWDRPAELALAHLRAAKSTTETRGRGEAKKTETIPGVTFKDRAQMVEAIAPVALSLTDQATADVNATLAAIDKLAEAWNATELLLPVRNELKRLATAASLVSRKQGGNAAPAPAPAPAPAAEPVEGAAELESALEAELVLVRQLNAMRAARK